MVTREPGESSALEETVFNAAKITGCAGAISATKQEKAAIYQKLSNGVHRNLLDSLGYYFQRRRNRQDHQSPLR
jgi:hypothetical protein